ncbi:hypothetical protein IUY40_04705 [Flavobacterium sp. ALJ2]|uniref:hypothetical protein n=1 Tax=Flavobacterium sp. ALJ2 TaxID=2786960 RepID=UPI00189E46ED|nr:hypothetical protein [Flavobacterium sp. ALJ2]MBF7090837.1 hypothetical protein [Flavobacterium sp. ALJ2]
MKLLKRIIQFLVIILILSFLYNYGVKLIDEQVGKKYVTYWKHNTTLYESVPQDENFTFKNFEKNALKNDLILYGEFHGVKETIKIDLEFIKYLNRKVGMKTHLAEFDFSQAYFLNEYLENGNDTIIGYVLNKWIINHGHHNKDYKSKWVEIREINKKQPNSLKIKIYGIDKIQDIETTQNHLNILFKKLNILVEIPKEKADFIKWGNTNLSQIVSNISRDTTNTSLIEDILHIKKNLVDYPNTSRENIMFSNFKDFYKRYKFKNKKIYGYFGEAHVLQKEMNHIKDFGTLIKESNMPIKNKTYTVISRYLNSYMAAPSKFLPFFIRDSTEHTKMNITSDNCFLLYHYGINDLKKVTKENTTTFFEINNVDSPYKNSLRLVKSLGLFSLMSGMQITDKKTSTTDYAQAIILIRNSDWAEPMKE